MKSVFRYGSMTIFISLLFSCILLSASFHVHAAENKRVRAKIGIQIEHSGTASSAGRVIRARSRENLKPGDAVRLYVHAENSCYVYIVYTDGTSVDLLNITAQKVQSTTLILPSAQAFYEIDGQSSMEQFTIICSPKKIPELSGMESKRMNYSQWMAIQANLEKKSRIPDLNTVEEPFGINGNIVSIAGNVRGMPNAIKSSSGTNDDPFLKELQIFSGHGLLIKTYQFRIKRM